MPRGSNPRRARRALCMQSRSLTTSIDQLSSPLIARALLHPRGAPPAVQWLAMAAMMAAPTPEPSFASTSLIDAAASSPTRSMIPLSILSLKNG